MIGAFQFVCPNLTPFLNESGICFPSSFFIAGLGSKRSIWLTPPIRKTKMHRLAVAGKCGERGRSGSASDFASCSSNDASAASPSPLAVLVKNRRRVVLLSICSLSGDKAFEVQERPRHSGPDLRLLGFQFFQCLDKIGQNRHFAHRGCAPETQAKSQTQSLVALFTCRNKTSAQSAGALAESR